MFEAYVIRVCQVPHEPSASAEGAAGRGRAHVALHAHHQLDRAEAQQRVREGAGAAQHGGLPHRHHDAHPGTVPLKFYLQI